MFREHEIADVHVAGAEPVVVRIVVVVDPPNYLVADDEAGGRAGVIGTGPEPSVEGIVAGRNQNRRVVGSRRAKRDGAVLARLLSGHTRILPGAIQIMLICSADSAREGSIGGAPSGGYSTSSIACHCKMWPAYRAGRVCRDGLYLVSEALLRPAFAAARST